MIEADIEGMIVEEIDTTLTKTVPDPEKRNYKEVLVGEAVKFKFYICTKRFQKIVGV